MCVCVVCVCVCECHDNFVRVFLAGDMIDGDMIDGTEWWYNGKSFFYLKRKFIHLKYTQQLEEDPCPNN